jgi:hypothetical protein
MDELMSVRKVECKQEKNTFEIKTKRHTLSQRNEYNV